MDNALEAQFDIPNPSIELTRALGDALEATVHTMQWINSDEMYIHALVEAKSTLARAARLFENEIQHHEKTITAEIHCTLQRVLKQRVSRRALSAIQQLMGTIIIVAS